MRKWIVVGLIVVAALVSTLIARSFQSTAIRTADDASLREYAGVYQWAPNAFLYLQLWPELTGTNQLVAFDETGEVRMLYLTARDRFFAGPGAAVPTPVESRIEFQRANSGKITSLTWARDSPPLRIARRANTERREDVRFSNGDVQLAGTLISPNGQGPHPALILVHASGRKIVSTCFPSPVFSSATAWLFWGTTSEVLAPRRATGTRRRSTIWPETSWPLSST